MVAPRVARSATAVIESAPDPPATRAVRIVSVTTEDALAIAVDPPRAVRDDAAALGISRARTYFPELEALRGVAVLLVFAMHANGYLHPLLEPWSYDASPLSAFVRDGRTGVNVFFVLSGFLISLPFVQAARGGRPVEVREYLVRRALRILPLYASIVAIATVSTAATPAQLLSGVRYLFFLNAFTIGRPMLPWSAVWWSLATEVEFYAVLPVAALVWRRSPRVAGALLGGYLVARLAYDTGFVGPTSATTQILIQSSLFGRAPLFLGGVVAAVAYDRGGAGVRARLARVAWLRNGIADLLLVGVLGGLALFLRWTVALGPAAELPRHQYRDFVDAAAWTSVLLLLLVAPLRLRPLVANPVLARVGVLSYSIYLLHNAVLFYGLRVFRGAWPGLEHWTPATMVVIGILGLVCVAIASVSFRDVEQPFLRWKARFDSRARA